MIKLNPYIINLFYLLLNLSESYDLFNSEQEKEKEGKKILKKSGNQYTSLQLIPPSK